MALVEPLRSRVLVWGWGARLRSAKEVVSWLSGKQFSLKCQVQKGCVPPPKSGKVVAWESSAAELCLCTWSGSAEHLCCPQHTQGSAPVSRRAAEANGDGIIELSLPGPCWGNKLLCDGHLSSVLCATCAGGGVPCSLGLLVWSQSPVCVWWWLQSGPSSPLCVLSP